MKNDTAFFFEAYLGTGTCGTLNNIGCLSTLSSKVTNLIITNLMKPKLSKSKSL